jgi:hypothetical protein
MKIECDKCIHTRVCRFKEEHRKASAWSSPNTMHGWAKEEGVCRFFDKMGWEEEVMTRPEFGEQ